MAGASLPAKGHWTGNASTPAFSNTYRVFKTQYGQWIFADDSNGVSPIVDELPAAGVRSNWIPNDWTFVPQTNVTLQVTHYFEPDPQTWKTDDMFSRVQSSAGAMAYTPIIPSSTLTLVVNGGTRSVTPSFIANTVTMAFTAGVFYWHVFEFGRTYFDVQRKCKAHVTLSGPVAPLSGNDAIVPGL